MRRAGIALSVVVMLFGAAPALAQGDQGDTVLIDVNMTLYGVEGQVIPVAVVTVDPELIGATCTGTARTENNASEHPGNDFILTSGASVAEIPNFEAVAGYITSMSSTLVLGETITASIRLGPDGVASEGIFITLACLSVRQPPPTTTTTTTTTQPPATTTTQPPATTTTTQPPATTTTEPPPSGSTTTTEEPPEGGVDAGGGSTAGGGGTAALWIAAGGLTLVGAFLLAVNDQRRISRGD